MRKPILAGNWKMNKTPAEAVEFVRALRPLVTKHENVETVVCVPFVALPAVADALRGVKVGVGAEYVIIGHSERREYFAETDETVNKKIKAALSHSLTPIVCCGERLDQRERGETDAFVSGQVRAAFAGLSAADAVKTVVAYERWPTCTASKLRKRSASSTAAARTRRTSPS